MSLLRGLLANIEAIAREHGAPRVRVVRLKLGPLAHIEPEHLREHFMAAARETLAAAAHLEIETTEALHELTLESVDLEWPDSATTPATPGGPGRQQSADNVPIRGAPD